MLTAPLSSMSAQGSYSTPSVELFVGKVTNSMIVRQNASTATINKSFLDTLTTSFSPQEIIGNVTIFLPICFLNKSSMD
jgi:hypothetical protein